MNSSTLLLFLCAFALSEVLLVAKKVAIFDTEVNNPSVIRAVRSERKPQCPNNRQCDQMCKFLRTGLGQRRFGPGLCICHGEMKPYTKEICEQSCEILGVNGGEVRDEKCFCNLCQ
ncbi:hypothetical protein DdX_17326 [Ditylenchus destructor]|uniref:Uncharacterized protein n=1 Tax=Ditylenchus destructor TaxID=166010 RepID=A0AAD4QZ40_9BILA|nr:hypothetical protein DdX_17326 [Ditylenchus destructor]